MSLSEVEELNKEIAEQKKVIENLKLENMMLQLGSDKVQKEYEEVYDKMAAMLPTAQTSIFIEIVRQVNHDVINGLLKIQQNLMRMSEYITRMPKAEQDRLQANIRDTQGCINHISSLTSLYSSDSFNFKYEDLEKLISNSITLVMKGDLEGKKGVVVEYRPPVHELPPIYCIRAEISLIIYNVLDNARKAIIEKWKVQEKISDIPEGGVKIDLDYDEVQRTYIIRIEDTGIGIPREHLDEIFKLGFTTHRERSGIGLYLTKQIVETKYDGTIDVESALGKGSIFVIKIRSAQV